MSAWAVDELAIAQLPVGATHRLWLNLVHDGLGQAIRLPVLVARGAREGPVCGLTAAVHGNEVNGIPVIHRLFARIDPKKLRGTLIGVPVVNVGGYLLHQRRTDDGFDLNHLFPGTPTGREAQVYAYRFFNRVIRQLDMLIDLHTASFGRVNCLYVRANMTDAAAARMAYLQRPQIILHSLPADGSLRGAAEDAGIPAITVEIGNPHRIQREYIKRSVAGIRAVLTAWHMLPKRPVTLGEAPVLCASSEWLYTDQGGFLTVLPRLTEQVNQGQLLAQLVDAFGTPVRDYKAPCDGIVIGHSTDPVAQTGARILHLGTIAPPDSTLLQQDHS